MSSNQGYIYVLINPSMEGLVKIGKTVRDPEGRVRELSGATGVPTPFYLVYKAYFDDCTWAEEFVHARLEQKNYRVSPNREFFNVPVQEAIDIIIEAKQAIKSDATKSSPNNLNGQTQLAWQTVYEEALDYYYGRKDYLLDYKEALKLFKQAAKLGCPIAFLRLSIMCLAGEGCKVDKAKSIEYLKEGTRHNDHRCWAEMAQQFFIDQQFENAEKC